MRITSFAALLLVPALACAQGALTPPGAPEPTQKSLQEIWDRIGQLEGSNSALQQQIAALRWQNAALLENVGGPWQWQLTTVAPTNDSSIQNLSLAFDPDGRPAIAFSDSALRCARFDGAAWQLTTVASVSAADASLAFDGAQPAIAYLNSTDGSLNFARFDGTTWQSSTVVASGVRHASLAFNQGQAFIAFSDASGLNLARLNSTWQISAILPADPAANAELSLTFTPTYQAAVAFCSPAERLYFAYFNPDSAGWGQQSIPRYGLPQKTPSLAFAPANGAAIAYHDSLNGDLKFASFDATAGAWQVTTVDSTGSVGETPSLAFTPATIAYYDSTNGDLKLARLDGSTWKISTVDSAGDVGREPSLAYSPKCEIGIAYYDSTNKTLKFALRTLLPRP